MTIHGTDFQSGAGVTFGTASATVISGSSESLLVTVPAGMDGASVAVTVNNPNGASVRFASEFTYTPSLLPDGGSPPSVQTIVVTGDNDYSELNNGCALVNDSAWCWGDNSFGQLGDTSATYSSVPIQVSGLASAVQAIAGGGEHLCAVVGGGVQCWGYNGYGELGNNSTTNSFVPVQVSGATSGVTAIAAGDHHTCAVVNSSAWCWGANYASQLGTNPDVSIQSSVPVQVRGPMSGVTAIAAANSTTCAVVGGGAWCWGNNGNGQLGNGTTESSSVSGPVSFSGERTGVAAIAVGEYHACALVNGGAWCWGANNDGQLGNATTPQSSLAVQVSGLGRGVTAIAAGQYHTCAVVDGRVWCWGDNTYGELGNDTTTSSYLPVLVSGLTSGVTAIAAGGLTTCALVAGSAWCWGSGALGSSTATNSSTPVLVSGL